MAYTANGVTVIDDSRKLTVDGYALTVLANTRTSVGVFANNTTNLSPSTFQGSVSGYTSGGYNPSYTNVIDKFSFASATTNATDVGDLTSSRGAVAGHASTTHGFVSAGYISPYPVSPAGEKMIDKFPFSTDTNSSLVGNLPIKTAIHATQSSEVSGYATGGFTGPATNSIQKFTFAYDEEGTLVGNLTQARGYTWSGQSSTTHGYTSTGYGAPQLNTIDRYPFAADTNATDVGDATIARFGASGQSSSTHGYITGGYIPGNVYYNTIEKFPFAAATTNATDVGDLTTVRGYMAGQSSTTHGYSSGGIGPGNTNTIERFPFSSDTNGSDVGDLTQARYYTAGNQARTLS